jgi:thermitase
MKGASVNTKNGIARRVRLFAGASAAAVLLGVPTASFAANAGNVPADAQADQAVSTPIAHSAFGNWAKGRILVAPNAGLSDDDFAGVLAPHGGKSLGKVRGLNVHVVELPANANEEAVASALSHNPHIKFAEVDRIVSSTATTNDPILPQEWQISKIGASTAWNTATGAGIVVAVLDSGVQSNHPDLQANLVPGWNVYNNNNLTTDVNGHGTAVAGTIAAIGNNGIGDAGVAYRAKIMPVRISDASCNTTLSLVASGITWAADHGADIANVSYSNLYKSSTVIAAATYLRTKGGETVVSANNNAINEGSANTTSMITVSATDQYDKLASFSSWGPMVDVAAPGVAIQTTLWNSGYGWGTGTSFSTPVVAGTVALIMSTNPALTPTQVENILFSTATNLGVAGYDYYFGWGRVNAAAAVAAAKSTTTTTQTADTAPPTVAIVSPTGGTVSGIVPVSVSAADNVGVTKVELWVGGVLLASDTVAPWTFSWDTTKKANGTYAVDARAYDAAGHATGSAYVNITVANGTTSTTSSTSADTIAPVAHISKPWNGTWIGTAVPISASATDNVGVASISVYVDGVLIATGNAASLYYYWDCSKLAHGTHKITATAKDKAGNAGSTSISVYH